MANTGRHVTRAAAETSGAVDVLVIDDSEIALELILGVLEASSFSVTGLPGPIGATRAVISRGVRVVVTDVNMPELTGNNLVSLFRNNPKTAHVRSSWFPTYRSRSCASWAAVPGLTE
jgi:CheY-like chemotaxis protein